MKEIKKGLKKRILDNKEKEEKKGQATKEKRNRKMKKKCYGKETKTIYILNTLNEECKKEGKSNANQSIEK